MSDQERPLRFESLALHAGYVPYNPLESRVVLTIFYQRERPWCSIRDWCIDYPIICIDCMFDQTVAAVYKISNACHCSLLLSTTASMELISLLERHKTLLIVGLEMYEL